MMVGRKVKLDVDKDYHEPGEEILKIKGLTALDSRGGSRL